jgi:hypothetical protein
MSRRKRQSGVAMVEFALAGVASIFTLICTFHLAYGMWNYHVITQAVHETSRYLAVKGVNCTKPGNTCSATVAKIAQKFHYHAIGLPQEKVNLTLTTASGTTTSCSPINTCYTNTTVWPPSTNKDNDIGKTITLKAGYLFESPILFFWPGRKSVKIDEFWLRSYSTQTIIF